MRRLPIAVPETMSRLLRSDPNRPAPVWYQPVLQNPPPVQPARRQRERPSLKRAAAHSPENSMTTRPNNDHPRRAAKDKATQKGVLQVGPRPIHYEEDLVRRQFFRDFPFEALRPISLLEMNEVKLEDRVQGKRWTKLEQRGRYPTVEDTILFVINLHKTRGMTRTQAYNQAKEEFVKLRAQHEMSTFLAEMEGRHWGAEFHTEFDRAFELERKYLDQNKPKDVRVVTTEERRIKWRPAEYWASAAPERAFPPAGFTHGRGYFEHWRRPFEYIEGRAEEAERSVAGSGAGGEATQLVMDMSQAIHERNMAASGMREEVTKATAAQTQTAGLTGPEEGPDKAV